MRLFSNISQVTSKCGKNKKVHTDVSLMFLPHFDFLYDQLLNRCTFYIIRKQKMFMTSTRRLSS